VIKLESVHIEEIRGIRKLDLNFGKEKFAISGPNGTGKRGVIDAIEFALTGQIGRLTGRGTKGLSVPEHGPHVDKAKFPDASLVTLRVSLTKLGKSATITRMVSSPKKPKIEPRVVKELERLEMAWLRILNRLRFRMGFSDAETAPTISPFTKLSYKLN